MVPCLPLLGSCDLVYDRLSRSSRERLLDSETAGSQEYGSSPTNIAAICVLPRQKRPRHPLSACSVAENKGPEVNRDSLALYILTKLNVRIINRITPYDATTYIICKSGISPAFYRVIDVVNEQPQLLVNSQ